MHGSLRPPLRWHNAGGHYTRAADLVCGKSNSIAWLAHQLIGREKNGRPIFDSIIVVTDRRILNRQNARIEHAKAIERVMRELLNDDMQLFKQYSDNDSFQRWLKDTVFELTYEAPSSDAGSSE